MKNNSKNSYLMTPSLLNSWIYAIESEKGTVEDFLQTLNRVPTPSNEYIEKGFMFEKWCEENYIPNLLGLDVQGGIFQYAAKKIITVDETQFLLYGRMDCLKAGTIYDFKYTGSYDCGKYYDSPQTSAYFELVPEAREMVYVVTEGAGHGGNEEFEAGNNASSLAIFTETYRRDEAKPIAVYIREFMNWLELQNYAGIYKERWEALE